MGGVESNQRWATARNRKGALKGDFPGRTLSSTAYLNMFSFKASIVALLVGMASAAEIRGAVPSSGVCQNEGDFQTGNHCVKMQGKELSEFQKVTNQNFGNPTEWCVCLHLFKQRGGSTNYPNADTSQCSKKAMTAAQ